MEEFWILILVVAFFATNSMKNAESVKVKLEEAPLKTFDEIFGEGWWDKCEAEELKTPAPTNFGQNVHHQIDRQNTQLGQTNSADQNPLLTESDHSGQIETNTTDQKNPPLTESDHSGQIETNTTDQNPPITESDHSGQIEPNSTNENIAKDERKRKIIDEFHAIKDEFKQKRKYSKKEWVQIEETIAKHLKVSRSKIYKWKKELDLNQRNSKNERNKLAEKFDQIKAELKRDGFKNSYKNELDKTVAKESGITDRTIKGKNPKIRDPDIAKMLKIGSATLINWKRQFKRQQFHPNSVDGHSVEENAAANIQKIDNSNSANI